VKGHPFFFFFPPFPPFLPWWDEALIAKTTELAANLSFFSPFLFFFQLDLPEGRFSDEGPEGMLSCKGRKEWAVFFFFFFFFLFFFFFPAALARA